MGMQWDARLSVGHPGIDAQHREIFRRFSDLAEGMAAGNDAELGGLFEFLGDYAVEHFAAEERLMAQTAYPGANVHAAAHARFVREYAELVGLWRANGATHGVAVKTRTWIEDWLRSHISGVDLALARYLRGRRVALETASQR
jgi:hemerythrin-like metal-binding protein